MMNQQRDPEERNQQLRVRYLLNELSEEEMKTILQNEEKAREKMRDQSNLLRMFCDVMGDMLRQLVVRALCLDEFLNNAGQLRDYFRESCRTIHNRYKCRTDWISDRWDLEKESHKPVQKQEVVGI
jgi:type I site-specific restriction endonuclease